jgi:1-acyl-sn-glycerol-3-phosphate acyltransferase
MTSGLVILAANHSGFLDGPLVGAHAVPVVVQGTGAALPRGARRPHWRAPVTVTYGSAVRVVVDGPPDARRTVAAAGEQLATELRAHLSVVLRRAASAPSATPARPRPAPDPVRLRRAPDHSPALRGQEEEPA